MPVYVGLFNFTESGLRAIRDSPARTREVVHWLEDQGFEIHGIYYTMGQYDLVCIIESPDEKSAAARGYGLESAGAVQDDDDGSADRRRVCQYR
ncbi:MAG: GYD domain-containing protein [Thermomicrobiales bacterium]